jgi:hypothetical protein
MTTGASAEAMARCLRAAGASRIEVWVLARTPLRRARARAGDSHPQRPGRLRG